MENSIDEIIKVIEVSPMWADINKRVKTIYEKFNRYGSDEEYRAVRGMILYKVMMEDKEVQDKICKHMYEYYRNK